MPSRPPSSPVDPALLAAKDRVFEKLAPLDFVSGAGVRNGSVAVYLTRALAPHEEQKVAALIGTIEPKPPVHFEVTGPFEAQ
jgi:hypothetical protein